MSEFVKTPAGPAWYAELPQLGVLEIAGADAAKFLQGQATCDVLALTDELSSPGAFCTAQGRVLAVFRVLRRGDRFLLIMPQVLIPDIIQRLRMYVLRSAVTVADVSGDWQCLGVCTRAADGLAWLGTADKDAVALHDGWPVLAWPSVDSVRAMVLVQNDGPEAVREQLLNREYAALGAFHWQLEEIRAGVPWVLPGTVEEFIPQMLNLDRLGGIGFKKGCYTGQEVVARTQYLGAVKRRMYRLELPAGSEPPAPGSRVLAQGEAQSVGTVVCAAAAPGAPAELLAVLIGEPAPEAALSVDGATAAVFELP
jgi:folate-binding protein YgfZ